MKSIYTCLSLGLVICFLSNAAEAQKIIPKPVSKTVVKNPVPAPVKKETSKETVFTTAEKTPEFPGGHEGLELYFVNALSKQNFPHPSEVLLTVEFDKAGKTQKAQIKKGSSFYDFTNQKRYDDPKIDSAVISAALKMPNWKPAENQEKPVAYRHDLLIGIMKPEDQKKLAAFEPFHFAEKRAEYPGGLDSMMAFIIKNMRYPEEAIANKQQGQAVVQVLISRFGEIKEARITKSVSPAIDQEVLRLVRSMPQTGWDPARNNGFMVSYWAAIPVKFKL